MNATATPAPQSAPTAPATAPACVLSYDEALRLPETASSAPIPVRIKRPKLNPRSDYERKLVTEGGWFLFFDGECCGWIRSFEDCRMNAWRPGVVAISHNPADTRVFLAVGGNYQDGAKRFQLIDPVGF
jgi:hypothetical protein